ncbi:MAG: asparagine synthase (glutamine-hydrolyzing) [Deltaproteobacteria bacterium]|nr:asparagine synthase (glutamine-hydrolyzing) [Deltaproteobacteria bacterium]
MCGIAGLLRTDGLATDSDRRAVRLMMDALHHRGPDDEGFYSSGPVALGHKRLSIIDLEGGHQPMTTDDGTFTIVLNGEIYNYLELRTELANQGVCFRTQSDTEVLLKLFQREGVTCLEKLNGMFAFAVWNAGDRSLILCRDRIGIKPLYYIVDKERLAFASEIKAFTAAKLVKPELNMTALEDYILLQMSLTDGTFFKGVKKILPGHTLTLKNGSCRIERYWDLDFTVDESAECDESAYVDMLQLLLEDAVRLQVRSDVPVGAHLSGGLDSSAVCCLSSKNIGSSLKTFTGYFSEGGIYDESQYARAVNDTLGTQGFFQEVNCEGIADELERLIYFMDEPQAGPGLVPQYSVSVLAREHVKVVLSGLGGDETFGGYARYYLAYLEECLKGAINETQREHDARFVVSFESLLPSLPLLKEYQPLMRMFWHHGLFEDPAKRYLRLMRRDIGNKYFNICHSDPERKQRVEGEESLGGAEERFIAMFNASKAKSLLNRMLAFDLTIFIPALLQVEDRTSMAVSLESRVPLLDHRIIELAAKMPPTVKWKGGRPKHVFREAVKNIVPKMIWNRKDKRGFPTPIAEWFNGPLKGYVHEIMTSKRACERGLYDQALFSGSRSRVPDPGSRPFDRSLWGALCVELWHRKFVDA